MEYETFLTQKALVVRAAGHDVPDGDIDPLLFPFQRDLTRWACRKGQMCDFC